jgi:hypothetical protein
MTIKENRKKAIIAEQEWSEKLTEEQKLYLEGKIEAEKVKNTPFSSIIGKGKLCLKCRGRTQRKVHNKNWIPRKYSSYFKYWDTCTKCHYVTCYDKVYVGEIKVK